MAVSDVGRRRWIIRGVIVAALVGIAFWMFEAGKEHSILVDNETAAVAGAEYAAVPNAALIVDGDESKPLAFEADDRLVVKMVGRSHTLRVTEMEEDGDTPVRSVERKIRIDFDTRAVMISLPAVLAGAENIYIPNPAAVN